MFSISPGDKKAMAFLNGLGKGRSPAENAALEPGALNPLVVETMAEAGYDSSHNPVYSLFDFSVMGAMMAWESRGASRATGRNTCIPQ